MTSEKIWMNRVFVWLIATVSSCCIQAQTTIVVNTKSSLTADTAHPMDLWVSKSSYIDKVPEKRSYPGIAANGGITWRLDSDSSSIVASDRWLGKNAVYIIEPGDSIYVEHRDQQIQFRGKGAEKFKLIQQIDSVFAPFKKHLKFNNIGSLKDYLNFSRFVDAQGEALLRTLKRFEPLVNGAIFERIKANALAGVEFERVNIFYVLSANASRCNLSQKDLVAIMDSTVNNHASKWLLSLSSMVDDLDYYYLYTNLEVLVKRHGFDLNDEAINTTAKRRMAYYNYVKAHFKGILKERLLVYILTSQTISNVGFTEETEQMLSDYYSLPDYPRFKKWVQSVENKSRILKSGKTAPDFSLIDLHGKAYSKTSLEGKIALLHFIQKNKMRLREVMPVWQTVIASLSKDTAVIVINIAQNRSELENYLQLAGPSKKNVFNLYSKSERDHQALEKKYAVALSNGFFLLDMNGNTVEGPLRSPLMDTGLHIAKLVKSQLAALKDGPYVCYNQKETTVYSFKGANIFLNKYPRHRAIPTLDVQSDEWGSVFKVTVRKKMAVEPSDFENAEKLLVISDIEGNFQAFRRLLLHGKVIDTGYNWTFGKGHLVLVGDFFDRGQQVTECLWLIYALEQKAMAKGGYVHFILGNHEIMNLNGKERYVQNKYRRNANIIGRRYKDLYNEKTELGRWLRTKNIIEKIGDIIFVHGGISEEVANLPYSISEINNLARSYYARDSLLDSAPDDIKVLFGTRTSPFWYRQYYLDEEMKVYSSGDTVYRPTIEKIDAILSRYSVRKIITGHTIIADTISQHYGGKVINTDTKHASGKSEALLVDNDFYYRLDNTGKLTVLLSVHDSVSDRNTTVTIPPSPSNKSSGYSR